MIVPRSIVGFSQRSTRCSHLLSTRSLAHPLTRSLPCSLARSLARSLASPLARSLTLEGGREGRREGGKEGGREGGRREWRRSQGGGEFDLGREGGILPRSIEGMIVGFPQRGYASDLHSSRLFMIH
jgi:hypothetical protein